MINESLKFLSGEVNQYLNLKIPNPTVSEPRLVVSNISFASETNSSLRPAMNNKAVLSLVNVEEDKVAKQQEHFKKSDTGTVYKNPPLYFNFYILFSMNRDLYDDNLAFLGCILQFFQFQTVFTPITHPSLDSRIQRLVVELYNMSFEQTNHLWSVMGGKYYPSVLYKVRQVTIDENATVSEAGFIKQINVNSQMKIPVTE